MHTANDVMNALGERLNAAGVALWDGLNAPAPQDGKLRVWAKHYPPVVPSLTVTVYGQEQSPNVGDGTQTFRVQVRTRANYNADTLADQAQAVLHGQHHQVWGDVHVARCRHISTAQIGLDGTTDERVDNYEITTMKGKAHDNPTF